MEPNDWRFAGFNNTGGAYDRKLAVNTPQARAQFNAEGGVNASSRIANPTNTNWNATFAQNNPSSPSVTDWGKTFGGQGGGLLGGTTKSPPPTGGSFAFNLSPQGDQSGLSLGSSPLVPSTYEPGDMSKHEQQYGWGGS